MDISIASLITSFLAGAPVGIATWEAFTNRSKLKLSLYEKRLEIFKDAHKLFLSLKDDLNKKKDILDNFDNEYNEYIEFTKKYRVAKFLFNPEDKILELLNTFRRNACDTIAWRRSYATNPEWIDRIEGKLVNMDKLLGELENKLQPYLQAPLLFTTQRLRLMDKKTLATQRVYRTLKA